MEFQLAFIGAGNMAEAIARGILASGIFTAPQMIACDPNAARRQVFQTQLAIRAIESTSEAATLASRILLAVKPQKIDEALGELQLAIKPHTPILSIVAAITTGFIEGQLIAKAPRLIRIMPNTPMLAGAGASGLCAGKLATPEDMALAERIFGSCGLAVRVEERLMDAVTSLSGSGPAYVFYLAEAMAAAGVRQGLPPDIAAQLARQTIIGAGALLAQSTDDVPTLRQKVTSPGGFTQAAVQAFEQGDLEGLVARAMDSALQRGKELSR